jgi:PHD/YefM family antitoxin component YafN of YafNO toxin-antitoxin module
MVGFVMDSALKTIAIADAARELDRLCATACDGPVAILRDGEPEVVLLSEAAYRGLAMRDQVAIACSDMPQADPASFRAVRVGIESIALNPLMEDVQDAPAPL